MDNASELLKLAERKFGKLTEAEKKLFRAAAVGEIADYSKPIDPANTAQWDSSRILLADRIAWLCSDKHASGFVTRRGIQIKAARIDEHFDLMFAKVPFPLFFGICKFTAYIHFLYAKIAALNMTGTHIGPFSAVGLKVEGPVYLCDGFRAEGKVNFSNTVIGGNLNCSKGQFTNISGYAFSANELKVGGSIFLNDGFKAESEVSLRGALIGGDLDCSKGEFNSNNGDALIADGSKINGSVYFSNGFKSQGEVRLHGAMIHRNLVCDGGQFINENGRAINADGVKVDESVFLRHEVKVKGLVSFLLAKIYGNLYLTDIDSPGDMAIDLRYAMISTLHDNQEIWPDSGQLLLHGLKYTEISDESPTDSLSRIKWLRLQKDFSPQPYEQLAKVLRENGDGAGARNVLVAKNKDKARRTKLNFVENCWYRFFGRAIGYGYKPWLVIPLAFVIILFGSVFFKEGYSHGLVTPLSESAYAENNTGTQRISEIYPVFNSLVYSIEVFLPVVDLNQAKYWLPNANRGQELVPANSIAFCTGGLLLGWMWFETACGWVLTILFLVGITGLVRT